MTLLLRFFSHLAVNSFAVVFAVVLSATLFVILPYLQFITLRGMVVTESVHKMTKLEEILPQKKTKAKPPEPKKSQLQPKPSDAPKSMARSRFAMDLGVGGGGAGGVSIAGGAAGSDVQSYEEGETDADATPIRQSPPAYPDAARKAGVSGKVRCLLTIDENGAVVGVQILEQPGDYGFEAAIREAVSKWRYKPAEVNGIPVRQKVEQPFEF